MASLLVLGFLLGLWHAIDSDHVAAVASLSTRTSSLREVVKVATVWGTGHALTLGLAVSGMSVLHTALPASLSAGLELAVGVTSILLGIDVLRRAHGRGLHLHVHEHGDGVRHLHLHAHAAAAAHTAADHRHAHAHGLLPRALLVGSLHGMAGSAVLVLAWVQTARSGAAALLSVAVFAIGTICGMVLCSLVIALPLRFATRSPAWVARGVEVAVGAVAVGVGIQIIAHLAASPM